MVEKLANQRNLIVTSADIRTEPLTGLRAMRTVGMAVVWTLEATRDLLSCWGSKMTQRDLLSVTRNRVVYEDIARSMQKKGHDFTWKQCRTKIKNLSQSYRRIKDSSKETLKKELAEPFIAELDVVFNRTPAELNTHGDSDRDSDEEDIETAIVELIDTTNTSAQPRPPDAQRTLPSSNPAPSLPLAATSSGATAPLLSLLMPTLLNTRPHPEATPLSGRAIAQLNTPSTSGHGLGQGVGIGGSGNTGVQAGGVVNVQSGSGLVGRGQEAASTAGGRGTQQQGERGGRGTFEQEEQEEQHSPLSTTSQPGTSSSSPSPHTVTGNTRRPEKRQRAASNDSEGLSVFSKLLKLQEAAEKRAEEREKRWMVFEEKMAERRFQSEREHRERMFKMMETFMNQVGRLIPSALTPPAPSHPPLYVLSPPRAHGNTTLSQQSGQGSQEGVPFHVQQAYPIQTNQLEEQQRLTIPTTPSGSTSC